MGAISKGSILILVVGVILLILGLIIAIPGVVKSYLGIPYAAATEYASILMVKSSLMVTGIIFIVIALIYTLFDALKSTSNRPKPKFDSSLPSENPNKTVCIFCDAENPSGTFYCLKCGKKIRRK